ncbi:hypothetical protein M0802_016100 [Mischocyttarus mexicanus]|nr:hypothetical protein M0802_016100 [Mischocyttarus mexicanus]
MRELRGMRKRSKKEEQEEQEEDKIRERVRERNDGWWVVGNGKREEEVESRNGFRLETGQGLDRATTTTTTTTTTNYDKDVGDRGHNYSTSS